jgi:hypothetical protein
LLLNKFLPAVLFLSFVLLLAGCNDTPQEKKNKAPLKDYKDPAVQLKEAKGLLGDNVKVTFIGNFDRSNNEEVIAGSEINTKKEWGIKFTSIDIAGEKPKKIFETGLLEGSFDDSKVEKLSLSSKDYELLYYNSGDYFMGTGGGEVLSYIVDFNEKEIYYAHLVADNKKVSLYLSGNINNDDVRKYFLDTFKRDFPTFILVSKDIEYDE